MASSTRPQPVSPPRYRETQEPEPHEPETLTADQIEARWEEIAENPIWDDVPYKIETDAYGQVVMDPPLRWHRRAQLRIMDLLRETLPGGETCFEMSVHTSEGTKVPDVYWDAPGHHAFGDGDRGSWTAPTICIEVRSPTNTDAEMRLKRRLYLEGGAEEVWVCDEDGRMRFFSPAGEWIRSSRAPTFPQRITIPKSGGKARP